MKINNIQLTTIKATDIKELQELCIVTFNETFADTNSKKSLKKYMNESFSEKKLMDEINNPESEFYFAKLDGKPIGYLKVNSGMAQTEMQDSNAIEIERIYVLKEFHGKGIGHILIDKAFQIAGSKKASYIWLGVWDKNLRAINFYNKYGFVEFDTHIFRMGDKEQTDLMMKLEL